MPSMSYKQSLETAVVSSCAVIEFTLAQVVAGSATLLCGKNYPANQEIGVSEKNSTLENCGISPPPDDPIESMV